LMCKVRIKLSSAAFLMFHVEQVTIVKECERYRPLTLNHLHSLLKTLLQLQFD